MLCKAGRHNDRRDTEGRRRVDDAELRCKVWIPFHRVLQNQAIYCRRIHNADFHRFDGAIVAVGDGSGRVGLGKGKAKEVSEAIRKATEAAKKRMVQVHIHNGTLRHEILSKFGASKALMKPAAPGTGLIAGGAARAVLEVAGIQNVLTKVVGSRNSHSVAKAILAGLQNQGRDDEVRKLRGMADDESF